MQTGTGRVVEGNKSINEGQQLASGGITCEKGQDRGSGIRRKEEHSDVRDFTRIQHASRGNMKGCGGWLKARVGMRRTVKAKQSLELEL